MPDVFPDPKWLELLKASRPQTAALSVACLLLLLAPHWEVVPPLSPWVSVPAFFVFALCGCLWIFSIMSAAYAFFPVHVWVAFYYRNWCEKKATESYIPLMTPKERQVIAYLLHHNQKLFIGVHGGGHAATLISRKIVVVALQEGQRFYEDRIPFAIPDHLWPVLVKHKDDFPYEEYDQGEPYPWQLHWMDR